VDGKKFGLKNKNQCVKGKHKLKIGNVKKGLSLIKQKLFFFLFSFIYFKIKLKFKETFISFFLLNLFYFYFKKKDFY